MPPAPALNNTMEEPVQLGSDSWATEVVRLEGAWLLVCEHHAGAPQEALCNQCPLPPLSHHILSLDMVCNMYKRGT